MTIDFDSSKGQKLSDLIASVDDRVDGIFSLLRGNNGLNRVFYSASALADHSLIWFIISLVLYFVKPRRRREAMRNIAILLLESFVVNVFVKSIFSRQRPVHDGERPLPLRIPITSSFPSGHATAATCAAVLFSSEKGLRWPVRLITSIVALSRIHVKIHHASDVAGGVIFGWIFAKAAIWLANKLI